MLELKVLLRSEPNRAPVTAYFQEIGLLDQDEEGSTPEGEIDEVEPISGYACVIRYSDSRGRASERRISCQRLEVAKGERYLRAFCYERSALRLFKLDRIAAVIDLHTGEVAGPEFFDRFAVGHTQESGVTWGLNPRQRSELIAALNALAFIARCDGQLHPKEWVAVAGFVKAYWIVSELPSPPPLTDVLKYAERLKPDPEVFFVSLSKCASHPPLAGMLRAAILETIEADGTIAKEELHYAMLVDRYLMAAS